MPPVSAQVKAQVIAVLQGLFPDPQALVSYGDPGTNQPDVIIGAGNIRTIYDRPTSGPNRAREQVSELDVVFSVYVAGDETSQQVATEAAYSLVGTFADYFKTSPHETLNGACRDAWVSRDELVETVAYDPEPNPPAPAGRVAEVTAVVQFKARV